MCTHLFDQGGNNLVHREKQICLGAKHESHLLLERILVNFRVEQLLARVEQVLIVILGGVALLVRRIGIVIGGFRDSDQIAWYSALGQSELVCNGVSMLRSIRILRKFSTDLFAEEKA